LLDGAPRRTEGTDILATKVTKGFSATSYALIKSKKKINPFIGWFAHQRISPNRLE